MENFSVTFQKTVEEPWLSLEPIYIGEVPTGRGTPDFFALIERNKEPFLRLNLYEDAPSIYQEIWFWKEWVVIGFSNLVIFFSPSDPSSLRSYSLYGYFGYITNASDYLLVTSAQELLCFDHNANLVWINKSLGLDGVIVAEVNGDIIEGEGEWDPPGGGDLSRLVYIRDNLCNKACS